MRRLLTITTSLLLVAAVSACDEPPTDLTTSSASKPSVENADPGVAPVSAPAAQSSAPFPTFHQGFNDDAFPWSLVTGSTSWCGSVERITRRAAPAPSRGRGAVATPGRRANPGPVSPSVGAGYALVEHGRCIPFFRPFTSAPASGPIPSLLSTTFPPSGFVQQLDIYLDPAYPAGTDGPDYDGTEGLVSTADGAIVPAVEDVVFAYAASLCLLEGPGGTCDIPAGLRYFPIAVTHTGGAMMVAGHEITQAGWYEFRHVFDADVDGDLTVEFQLVHNGRMLATKPIERTLNTAEPTGSFRAADLGSGYLWFISIADGLELPIDEHVLRPGS